MLPWANNIRNYPCKCLCCFTFTIWFRVSRCPSRFPKLADFTIAHVLQIDFVNCLDKSLTVVLVMIVSLILNMCFEQQESSNHLRAFLTCSDIIMITSENETVAVQTRPKPVSPQPGFFRQFLAVCAISLHTIYFNMFSCLRCSLSVSICLQSRPKCPGFLRKAYLLMFCWSCTIVTSTKRYESSDICRRGSQTISLDTASKWELQSHDRLHSHFIIFERLVQQCSFPFYFQSYKSVTTQFCHNPQHSARVLHEPLCFHKHYSMQ